MITTILLSLFSLWMIRLRYYDTKAFNKIKTDYKLLEAVFLSSYEQSAKQTIAFDDHLKSIIVLYTHISEELSMSNPELSELVNDGKLKIQRYREAYFDDKVEKANEFINKANEIQAKEK